MNNLPKVVTQQRRSRASNPRLLDRKSDALALSHRAMSMSLESVQTNTAVTVQYIQRVDKNSVQLLLLQSRRVSSLLLEYV